MSSSDSTDTSAYTAEELAYYKRYPDVYKAGMDAKTHYDTYGKKEGRYWGLDNTSSSSGSSIEMPDFASMFQNNYDEQYAQQKADAELSDAKYQIQSLYASKFDAADQATAEVNQQILDEQGHAKLMGLDYSVDDATKQQRINDLFANYWGESDDTTLSGLIEKYGDQGYTWDLPITRGTATAKTVKDKTTGDTAGKKVKAKGSPTTTAVDPLAAPSILG